MVFGLDLCWRFVVVVRIGRDLAVAAFIVGGHFARRWIGWLSNGARLDSVASLDPLNIQALVVALDLKAPAIE